MSNVSRNERKTVARLSVHYVMKLLNDKGIKLRRPTHTKLGTRRKAVIKYTPF